MAVIYYNIVTVIAINISNIIAIIKYYHYHSLKLSSATE